MTIEELHGKHILILGYGREGKSTKEFLKKFVPDTVVDTADQSEGKHYLEKQAQFDLAIKTPGIPKRLVSIPYTTASNIFFANLPKGVRTIGVTGSKGKSTTTSLIYTILKYAGFPVRIAGNIGKPMLDELMEPVPKDTVFVLEISSYQLEDLEYSPSIAVFLNIFPEHLDYHEGMEKYFDAKSRIVLHSTSGDSFVYNPDNPSIANLAHRSKAHGVPFIREIPFPLTDVKLKGKHNEEDIRAALTVAKILNIPMNLVQKALQEFVPLPHRMEFIGQYKGIKFYDDAIATAPEPTIYALETLQDVDTIFLGGTDRGLDFRLLAKRICQSEIRNIVLFPDTGKRILKEIQKIDLSEANILETESMEAAVRFAYAHTVRGKSCLLSTASPSYSLWKNFEEKGNEFQAWVKTLSMEKV